MEIRQSLEANFLTCRHCQQPYRKPKVLICLHTFCQQCLQEIFDQTEAEREKKEMEDAKKYYAATNSSSDYRSGAYRRKWSSKFRYGNYDSTNYVSTNRYPLTTTKSKYITCPICAKETALPPGGVSDLPVNQLADKLASMVDRMPTFPVCDVCTRKPLLADGHSQYSNEFNGTTTGSSDESSGEDGFSSSGIDVRSITNGSSSRRRMLSVNRQVSGNSGRAMVRHGSKYRSSSVLNNSDPRPACAACLECAKRLCSRCRDTHVSMPVTSEHVLIQVGQMDDLKCSRHPREFRRYFCLTCRTYICVVCTFETSSDTSGHAEHEIMSIREAVQYYQNILSRDSSATQTHVQQIESLLSSLHICEQEMQTICVTVDQGVEALVEKLKMQQKQLKEQVDKLAGIRLTILHGECDRMANVAHEWYEFLNDEHITSRLDLMDPLEALSKAGPMLDRVGQCLRSASEPLHMDLARQSFLIHLKAAETNALANGQVGKSVSTEPSDSIDLADLRRTAYWRQLIGNFEIGSVGLGRLVNQQQLNAEAKAAAMKWVSTSVQTGPELVKSLPPPKGALRHRAIQVNLLDSNLEDRGMQTDSVNYNFAKTVMRSDVGTQYQSSDINPPISMYRSLRQILVQK